MGGMNDEAVPPVAPPTSPGPSAARSSGRCDQCGYSLIGLPLEGKCPECGSPYTLASAAV